MRPTRRNSSSGCTVRTCRTSAKIPGVVRVRRYVIVDGPPDRRGYVAVIETEDLEASMAYRNSEAGRKPQRDSESRGVTNRYGLACREIFSIKFP